MATFVILTVFTEAKQFMARSELSARLDLNRTEPLYKQVEKRILQCLSDGEWKPGDQLPTEAQLAERFGVAVFTIRAGIVELAAANILVRKQGKGTFVARHSRSRQRYQFSHIHDEAGNQILPTRHLISFTKEAAKAQDCVRLQVPRGARCQVYRLRMLSKIAGETIATLEIVLPARLFAALTAEAVRDAQENLYAVYQDVCGVNVIRVEEYVYAGLSTEAEAKMLGLRPDSPVLRIERLAFTYQDLPVERRIRVFDGTRFHYRAGEGSL